MPRSCEGESTPVEAVSIADGLNAPFAGELAVRTAAALGVEPVLVSEDEIAEGFRFLYQRAKLACEPAGAAAVARRSGGEDRGRPHRLRRLGRERRSPHGR